VEEKKQQQKKKTKRDYLFLMASFNVKEVPSTSPLKEKDIYVFGSER